MESGIAIAPPLLHEGLSFEEGIIEIQKMESDHLVDIMAISERRIQMVLRRFREGAIIDALVRSCDSTVEDAVDRIASSTGLSVSLTWQIRKFYLHPQWGSSEIALQSWIESVKDTRAICWSYVRNYISKGNPGEKAETLEDRADRLERMARDLDEESDRLQEDLNQYSRGERLVAGTGIAAKAKEVASDTNGMLGSLELPGPMRDSAYLKWIMSLPCCATGRVGNVVAHHVVTHGKGVKCSDYATIPLDWHVHEELHRIGRKTFCARYDLDTWFEVAQCLSKYLLGQKLL